MLVGALAGFCVANLTANPVLGVLGAMLAGGMLTMIHAFVCIGLRAEQIVSGLALTLFGTGLTGFLGRSMVGRTAPGFPPIEIPGLSKIPILGPVFFSHDILVYMAYLLVPIAWFVLDRTRLGLAIRSVGESPDASDASGVNVTSIRYGSTFVGGALAGVGGAYPAFLTKRFFNFGWAGELTAFQSIARCERVAWLKHPVLCAGV